MTLPSVGSDSLPSISAGGSHEVALHSNDGPSHSVPPGDVSKINNKNITTTSGVVEDSQGYSSSSSSLVRSLGSLTPGLRSVVHQIRRRLAGDSEQQQQQPPLQKSASAHKLATAV